MGAKHQTNNCIYTASFIYTAFCLYKSHANKMIYLGLDKQILHNTGMSKDVVKLWDKLSQAAKT